MTLPQSLDAADFKALNICRSGDEWQASMNVEGSAWRIRVGATPSEALAALFAEVPSAAPALPPLPY